MVTKLTSENFAKEVEQSGIPVIVDFGADWCGPCKMMGPAFEKLEKEFKGKLFFAKIDVDKSPEIAEKNGIRGIPCLIVFSKGKEVARIIGYAGEEILKSKISEILGKI